MPKALLRDVLTQTLTQTLRKEIGAAPEEAAALAPRMADAVAPIVAHATNQEPWYQSRVTLGAIVSVAAPILGLVGIGADVVTPDELTALLVAVGSAVGGGLTIWGRWRASKPLGR